MAGEPRIRPITADDLAELLEIQAAAPQAAAWSVADYARCVAEPDGPRRCLAAERDSVLVGFALYAPLPGGEAEILNLAARPEWRRQGVASALLRAILSAGFTVLSLEVRESNAVARALYEKFGFEPVGRRPRYYHRPVEDALIYQMASDGPKKGTKPL